MATKAETVTFLEALICSNTKYGYKKINKLDLFSLKSGKDFL